MGRFRAKVRDAERQWQTSLRFSAEGHEEGFASVEADASRIRKLYRRGPDGTLQSCTHASAFAFVLRGSTKFVVVPMEPVDVKASPRLAKA